MKEKRLRGRNAEYSPCRKPVLQSYPQLKPMQLAKL
jgi:hypothetical protein